MSATFSNFNTMQQEQSFVNSTTANYQSYLQFGYNILPKYTIVMWGGNTVASIPDGWLLCDGRTVTVNGVSVTAPNLSGRFVLSYGQGPLDNTNTTIGATGGEQNHTLTTNEMPSHTHTATSTSTSTSTSTPTFPTNYYLVYSDGNNTSNGTNLDSTATEPNLIHAVSNSLTVSTSTNTSTSTSNTNTGGGAAHNNMPPYYVLCYIMKGF